MNAEEQDVSPMCRAQDAEEAASSDQNAAQVLFKRAAVADVRAMINVPQVVNMINLAHGITTVANVEDIK